MIKVNVRIVVDEKAPHNTWSLAQILYDIHESVYSNGEDTAAKRNGQVRDCNGHSIGLWELVQE